MPELPEIELYRKYLDETSLEKKIISIDFLHEGGLQSPKKIFEEALVGKKLKKSHRLGKYLLVETSGEKTLVLHFGMTGKLEYFRNQEAPKYSRVVFNFGEDEHLAFVCRRKLGKLFIAEGVAEFQKSHDLGYDALELKEAEFLELLEGKTGSIKAVLVDQHLLTGIGNVYSDEMLYQCKIHPKTKTNQISSKEKNKLYQKMKEILKKAIEVEGKRSDFPTDYLIQHRKDGEDCPVCPGKIKKIKVGGRSTYFCDKCQKEK